MARPRLPTELKRVRGTLRKHRTNTSEPKPGGSPQMPTYFDGEQRAAWEYHVDLLTPMGVLTFSDGGALEVMCLTYVVLLEAQRQLQEEGMTIMTDVGLRKHPAAGIAADANRQYQSWLTKFGLTPADRSRVSVPASPASQSGWAKLKRV